MKPVKICPCERSKMWKPKHSVWFKHNADGDTEKVERARKIYDEMWEKLRSKAEAEETSYSSDKVIVIPGKKQIFVRKR